MIESVWEQQRGEVITTMAQQSIRQGKQGMQQGRQEETRVTLLRILHRRFGSPPPAVEARLRPATLEQLEIGMDLAIDAPNLEKIFPEVTRPLS